MPCLLLIVVLAFPRLAIALLFFFTHYLDRAFHSILLLILGFIFLPFTTLVYAWLINSHVPVQGINLLWLLIAALVDLGSAGHGYSRRQA
jgi:phosphate starvation-inducible membrane PsiE